MAETLKRQCLWDRTGCSRGHRYAVNFIKSLMKVLFFFCFLPVKLTHFALCIMRLNSKVYILLAQDDLSSKVLSTSPPGRGEGVLPLSNIPTVKTRRVVGKLRAVWWTLSCKPFYFPALMEEFLFSWDRHKAKAVHFYLERSRNHLSAMSFPASTVKSSTIKLFDTGSQQLLNLFARKTDSTHMHTHVDRLTEGDVLSNPSWKTRQQGKCFH